MDNIRTELKKGVGFTLVTDKKFKNDLTYIAFRTGTGGEGASFASLLTGVLTCADGKYQSLYAINRALDALYDAQLNGRVMRSCFEHVPAFYIRTLNNRYAYDGTDIRAGGLGILSDVIFDPYMKNGLLCPANVESEKKQLTDAIRSIRNDRGIYAERRCLCGMFEDEPEFAPKYGTEEDAGALTAEKLTAYYKETLENAAVEIVTVTGEDGAAAKEYALSVADRLGDRKTGRVYRQPADFDGTVKRTEESEPVSQSVLCIGCDTGAAPFGKDSHVYAVYDEIFGHSATSRLFKNVREKLSLCYYCGTTAFAGLRKTVIRAELDAKNRDRAEEEIFRQLELMKTELSEDELEDGKRSLCSNCLSGTDSLSFTAMWYLSRALSGSEIITPVEYTERIKSVSRGQVFEAAEKVRPAAVYFMRGTV